MAPLTALGASAILAAMTQTSLPLAMIAALADNRVIGLDNKMPWHLPADLKHFKATTLGKPIIMGRKTWDSLGRPLPGRLNLVVSRQPDLRLEGTETFTSLEAARVRAEQWAREQGVDELMIIGGAQLYAQALGQAERLHLTRIDACPEGDTFFPAFDESEWIRTDVQAHPADGDAPAYRFETWQRR
jgi:dihydrofolate reductase